MATVVLEKPKVEDFPKAKVIAALTAELIECARAEAQVRGIVLPTEAPMIVKTAVPMDSLSVVDTLCAVEPIVGFELRESMVRTGGYVSIGEALEHLVPKIERMWIKKKGPKP